MVKETTLKELGEMMSYVVENMTTKDDIAAIRKEMATKEELAAMREEMATKSELADIRREMATKEDIAAILNELKDIKSRLRAVEEAAANHAGYSKEIDHAFERITAIERHLGITPQ